MQLNEGASALDAAKAIGSGLAKAALAAKINGKPVDLSAKLSDGDKLEIITFSSPQGHEIYWHSSSHLLAMAVKQLWPKAKLAIGPAIENGFYYDFDVETPFVPEDLEKIEKKMAELAAQSVPFERKELSRDEALCLFQSQGENYKAELVSEAEGAISLYSNNGFVDLCRGPHVPDTGRIRGFKLLSIAGAYWRGSEKNKMLQRIYGISFPDKKELGEYLQRIEEAEKRDHRRLGRELDLYSISEEVGPGLVLWHPKAGVIRSTIEDFWKREHYRNGYEIVYSPHIGRAGLWHTSGHLDFYKENMYAPMEVDEEEYYAKPMNCPFHIMMYKNRQRSYRDLPLRWAELGTVYRYEKSGVLHGLLRVRGFTQDDAHIICSPEQMPDEIRRVLRFCLHMLGAFGFKDFQIYLATKPKEKAVGDPSLWQDATSALDAAVKAEGLSCQIDEGGGAFYGPKIDIKIKDALNREWQCSTIQFDFNMSQRFDLAYIGANGERQRPYMIHRALLGSLERFMGVLIEHYAGDFPLWLAPVQVAVLPISEKFLDYAQKIQRDLFQAGIRSQLDTRNEKIGAKIRDAELQKMPYMAVVGQKEQEQNAISVRKRHQGDLGIKALAEWAGALCQEAQMPGSSL